MWHPLKSKTLKYNVYENACLGRWSLSHSLKCMALTFVGKDLKANEDSLWFVNSW
jgi:hypothetical protein